MNMTSGIKSWIFFGLTLAMILGIISTILVCLLFPIDPIVPIHTQQYTVSKVKNLHQFPIPKVVMMNKVGRGHLFTLKQNSNLSFELDWSFKLPRTGAVNPPDPSGYVRDVGHFLFEDQSQIYAIPSNMNQKMRVLQPPTKKHFNIGKSQIPEKFYISGHLVRAGDFVMIFGGYFKYLPYSPIIIHCTYDDTKCSSSKNSGGGPSSSTAIWSIKKRIWIKGPYLPDKLDKCFLNPTGFAINQNQIALLLVSQNVPDTQSNFLSNTGCIETCVFSFETMAWVDMNDCLIDTGIESLKYAGLGMISLASTTFFNKKGKLMVVINLNGYGYGALINRMYLLDYDSKEVQIMHTEELYEPKTFRFQSVFTLKNIVYMPSFPAEATDSCHHLESGKCVEQIQIFTLIENGTSNYSVGLFQIVEDQNLKHYIGKGKKMMMALPFQTSQSRLRHYKSVPIKDL